MVTHVGKDRVLGVSHLIFHAVTEETENRQLFGIHLLLNVSLKFNSQAMNSKRVLGEKNSNARFVSLTKHRKSVICNLFVIKEDKCILLFIELSI